MTPFSFALIALLTSTQTAEQPTTDSIYQSQSTWTDQNGKQLKLSQFKGQPVVMAMIFTSCAYSCPLTVEDLRAIEKRLSPEQRKKVRFVLVSFDPERDTPARLSEYAKMRGLQSPSWNLLTGSSDDVAEVAAMLNVRYRKTERGDYVHSNVITVLDGRGVIQHQQTGLGADPTESVRAIAK